MRIPVAPETIEGVRAFNRFWTARIGVLDATLLETSFSLTQARVLYELNQTRRLPVSTLLEELRVDPGYLSRLLKGLASRGLLTLTPDPVDRRRRLASLTADGRLAAADLERRSVAQLQDLLAGVPPRALDSAVHAMSAIRTTFADVEEAPPEPPPSPDLVLRDLRPGDLGWVISRHGALYAAEYSWDVSFESLVARIVADFATSHDPARERAWIADVDGVPAGCIFCVRAESSEPETAQLRLLLVEPTARGHGVASALVQACLAFACAAGYARIVLWTNDVLTAARRIYEREGFTLISEEPHTSFGHELVGQRWGRDL